MATLVEELTEWKIGKVLDAASRDNPHPEILMQRAAAEITRLQAELDAKGKREVKVRWEDRLDQRFPIAVAFVGSFKVGAIEQASTNNKLWHTYVGLKRLDSFVELSDARAAVEAAALSALCEGE